MKGRIKAKAQFQDWWKDQAGSEVTITGEEGRSYVTDKKNPFTGANLLIPKDCVDITDDHPNLSHLTDEILLREVKDRGLKLK